MSLVLDATCMARSGQALPGWKTLPGRTAEVYRRPHDLATAQAFSDPPLAPEITLQATVSVSEITGSESYVHPDVGAHRRIAPVPGVRRHAGDCGPTLTPKTTAEERFARAEKAGTLAPQRKLANEEPKDETIDDDTLARSWPASSPKRS